jgi:heavy metal sensor kinase
VSRVPIRIRVTLAFALVMAIVLAAVGFFLRSQLETQLDESIDENLTARAGQLSVVLRESGAGLSGANPGSLLEQEDTLAQVLEPGGEVVDSTAQLGGEPVLTSEQLGEASTGSRFFDVGRLPGLEGETRVFAAPVEVGDEPRVVAVGSSLEDRDEALQSLTTLMLIGGPVALLLASLAGYGVAAAALRPVEAMRERAAEISAGDPGERLPVPPASDELSRLGTTLNEMLGRLEDALARERRFVDDAAHELRTPLALHKTELELALRYQGDEAELRTAIASAVDEIDRLIQLAEDLLVVARAEDGELKLSPEELEADALLGAVAERFRARAAEAGRSIVIENGEGIAVRGDRLRLEQALTSLLDNALRHGGGDVHLSALRRDGTVELHVADDGPGFDEEFIPRAFERFSRADAARTGGGAGLGLSIVDTIARAHGGRAVAANGFGGGADVFITLPLGG